MGIEIIRGRDGEIVSISNFDKTERQNKEKSKCIQNQLKRIDCDEIEVKPTIESKTVSLQKVITPVKKSTLDTKTIEITTIEISKDGKKRIKKTIGTHEEIDNFIGSIRKDNYEQE